MNTIQMTDAQALLFRRLQGHNITRYDEDLYLYKYVTIATAKLILGNGSLKFSTPVELNDRDLEMCLFNVNLTHKQIEKRKKSALKKGLSVHENLDKKQIKKVLRRFPAESLSLDDEGFKQMTLDAYKEQHKNVGLFCATTSYGNEKMWAKYADNHSGVCIQYKFPSLFNKAYFTFKVLYDQEFKPYDLFDRKGRQDDVALYRWLFAKRMDYAFEDEVRMFSEHKAGIFILPKEVFTGVYYGKNTSQEDIEAIEKLIQKDYSFNTLHKAVY